MGKRWPALDVDAAGEADAERILAIADDFAPTAVEATAAGLRIFFSSPSDRDRAAGALQPHFSVSPADVPDDDWARRSQENLTPISVGRIVVAPPWHSTDALLRARAADRETPIAIVISPSMGFGTGHHATTRLCLAALQAIDLQGASVLDAGTGSGLLAVAAVCLGASHAFGVDDDPDAIQSAVENLEFNPGVARERVTFAVGDLTTMALEPADVVTANLTGGLLIRSAERLGQAVKPGGILIMSGLQNAERDEVWAAFEGFGLESEATEDGWTTFTARKRSNESRG